MKVFRLILQVRWNHLSDITECECSILASRLYQADWINSEWRNSISDVIVSRSGHGYNMYTHNGQDYWTSGDCGMPGCRTCGGGDHLINRDVGYLRRNELGRTIDRGFSSKPWKLRLRDGDYDSNGNWAPRYDPQSGSDTARTAMRDPFNRPVDGPQTWTPRYDYGNGDKRWERAYYTMLFYYYWQDYKWSKPVFKWRVKNQTEIRHCVRRI